MSKDIKQANQWFSDPRQELFLKAFLDPKSPTWGNFLQSGLTAGYKDMNEGQANAILRKYRKSKETGFIYLMRCNSFYKIGITNNIDKRLENLQSGNPEEVVLISFTKSHYPKKDESKLHSLMADYRIRGEWFKLPRPLVSSIVLDFYNHGR